MEGANEGDEPEPEPRQVIHTFTLPIEMLQGFMNMNMNMNMNSESNTMFDNPLEGSITNRSFHEQPKYKNVSSKDFINSLSVQKVNQDIVDKRITCGICLDELVLGEDIIELPCKDSHYFHIKKEECLGIYPWLKEHNTCPLCRHEFESEEKEVEVEEPEILPLRIPTAQNIRAMVYNIIDEEEERMLQDALYQSLENV